MATVPSLCGDRLASLTALAIFVGGVRLEVGVSPGRLSRGKTGLRRVRDETATRPNVAGSPPLSRRHGTKTRLRETTRIGRRSPGTRPRTRTTTAVRGLVAAKIGRHGRATGRPTRDVTSGGRDGTEESHPV